MIFRIPTVIQSCVWFCFLDGTRGTWYDRIYAWFFNLNVCLHFDRSLTKNSNQFFTCIHSSLLSPKLCDLRSSAIVVITLIYQLKTQLITVEGKDLRMLFIDHWQSIIEWWCNCMCLFLSFFWDLIFRISMMRQGVLDFVRYLIFCIPILVMHIRCSICVLFFILLLKVLCPCVVPYQQSSLNSNYAERQL